MIRLTNNPWSETRSGKRLHFVNPCEDEIDIKDIAHALSQLCRYAGHCDGFYSVAAHSIGVFKYLEQHTEPRPSNFTLLAALLHDASEAYLGDLPGLLKPFLPGYLEIEQRLQNMIYKKYLGEIPRPMCQLVIKKADLIHLKFEAVKLCPSKGENWLSTKGLEDVVQPKDFNVIVEKTPHIRTEPIENEFMFLFNRYMGRLNGSKAKRSEADTVEQHNCDRAAV